MEGDKNRTISTLQCCKDNPHVHALILLRSSPACVCRSEEKIFLKSISDSLIVDERRVYLLSFLESTFKCSPMTCSRVSGYSR